MRAHRTRFEVEELSQTLEPLPADDPNAFGGGVDRVRYFVARWPSLSAAVAIRSELLARSR